MFLVFVRMNADGPRLSHAALPSEDAAWLVAAQTVSQYGTAEAAWVFGPVPARIGRLIEHAAARRRRTATAASLS
ncbi:MAG TPA: hypothetical protein VIV06_04210 [Candidatus Limnocylindrales bacterium]